MDDGSRRLADGATGPVLHRDVGGRRLREGWIGVNRLRRRRWRRVGRGRVGRSIWGGTEGGGIAVHGVRRRLVDDRLTLDTAGVDVTVDDGVTLAIRHRVGAGGDSAIAVGVDRILTKLDDAVIGGH